MPPVRGAYALVQGRVATEPADLAFPEPGAPQQLIEFTFKIDGMTCVACSGSIERLMHNSWDSKGLAKVSIVLLTHKMVATFPQAVFDEKTVTPAMICDNVEMIGFGCELLGMTEISEQLRVNLKEDGRMMSESSLDSRKIRGDDDSFEEIPGDLTPSNIKLSKVNPDGGQ